MERTGHHEEIEPEFRGILMKVIQHGLMTQMLGSAARPLQPIGQSERSFPSGNARLMCKRCVRSFPRSRKHRPTSTTPQDIGEHDHVGGPHHARPG